MIHELNQLNIQDTHRKQENAILHASTFRSRFASMAQDKLADQFSRQFQISKYGVEEGSNEGLKTERF